MTLQREMTRESPQHFAAVLSILLSTMSKEPSELTSVLKFEENMGIFLDLH
jgi:hypothetical protein